MKKALSVLLALILCLPLCACGNQDKYKKYDTLIDYIEAGDSGNAINEVLALIGQNGAEGTETPEVATTTVEITLDNWQEYFEIVLGASVSRNAFDEIENMCSVWRISLKEKYREALTNADVAFGCRRIEYSKCEFTYDLQTEQTTMSVTSPSDFMGDLDETYSFEYDNSFLTLGDNFSVGLTVYLSSMKKPSVDGNKVTWKGNEYARVEMTRVQGTLTLKVE